MNRVLIMHAIYANIINTVGAFPPESGGIIADQKDFVVCEYYFDEKAGIGQSFYRPTAENILRVVNESWRSKALSFCGMVHSHPGSTVPSAPDIKAAVRIMKLNNMTQFIMPILNRESMDVYIVELCDGVSHRVRKAEYSVISAV